MTAGIFYRIGRDSMLKNDLVELRITDFTQEGLGVGHAGGMAVFVKDTVIGDLVSALITKVKKNYAYGRVMRVLEESPDRVTPPCPAARPCGGCQIQMMDYQAQLRYKQEKVKNCLIRIGGFPETLFDAGTGVMEPILGMDDPFRYRNKAQYPVGRDKNGDLVAGFYAGRTHSIIDCRDCLIGVPENARILDIILAHMKKNRIEPYDELTGNGLVRHVMIRKGFASGQIMVVLVLAGKDLPGRQDLIARLEQVPGITSIAVNINRKNTNVIFGEETRVLYGKGWIEDSIRDVRFRIGARSFYQVNPVQTEKLYGTALDFASLTGKETVWDLYCGIGTISLFLARHAAQVHGVEIVPEAIEDARENARINGITNAMFYAGKAEEILPEKYRDEQIRADVIVVDPPRKGCERSVLDTMLAMAPERIVYVSCDPATLARDLKYLCDGGYTLQKVQAVDQFCHTVHVETVCLLSQRKPDTTIEVDLDISEKVNSIMNIR